MEFDVVMPLVLFAVTVASLLLNPHVEGRLKTTLDEREFHTKDALLFVVATAFAVSVIVFVPKMAVMSVFLFAYCSLLFTFSLLFSNISKRKSQVLCLGFGIASLIAGTAALQFPLVGSTMFYGGFALCGLAIFAFSVVAYEQKRVGTKERWYLAFLPSALFILLYLVYNGTILWFPFLLNGYAVMFAVLITLFLGSMFSWRNVFIFALLLTAMDIILVLVVGVMVTAADQVAGLGLPVLVSLPTIPLVITEKGLQYMSLGLGDFFFAGMLATQTHKKFGQKTAVESVVAMSLSFSILEVFLLNSSVKAFPGTLMIICGWLPVIAWKLLSKKGTK